MAEYLTPGVFVEDIKQTVSMPVGTDPVSAFIGVANTGPVNTPTSISSWNEYLTTFATGQDSAFLTNSYLAYAVYGFFQNGGRKCYVMRVTNSDAAVATTGNSSATAFEKAFKAKNGGSWGNKITIEIPKDNIDTDIGIFAVNVKYGDTIVESWGNLGKGVNVSGCYADIINAESNYIKVTDLTVEAPLSTLANADTTIKFAGGTDGLSTSGSPVSNDVYKKALEKFDLFEEIRLVAIPGADNALQKEVADYCTKNKYRIAICEGNVTDTDSQLKTLRTNLNGTNAALYGPWIKVVNPLSSSGALIPVPACGHICGVYSRISDSMGFWEAPAGTEAVIRGAVDLTTVFTLSQTNVLNPKGINCLLPKTNIGVCVWGARSCNNDFNYVSDLLMNITLKKNLYDLTQKYVFKSNDSTLWTKVKTTCQDYLNSLYQQGAFFGDSPSEAYYVECNETLNPVSVRNQGKLICEIGYAAKKPAEFIIFRISHELTTA